MASPTAAASKVIRFGIFELDPQSGELRRDGVKVRLEGQPWMILTLLIQRPGELVTREELKEKLWPADTFVDFEHSINVAVKRLREALQDSATSPRYIQTLPRRGYRFVYPIANGSVASPNRPGAPKWISITATGCLLAIALAFSVSSVRERFLGRRIPGKILRVAVLPMKSLSDGPEQEYFAGGMTEMLITELGRMPALQVTSHQSVLGYAQSTKAVPQIAGELGVDAIVEGTVQRSGDRVRVTINFVQAQPENHLLAQSFENDARDVFRIQQQVAEAIAGAVQLSLPEANSVAPLARQIPPDATDAYLRGTYLLAKGTDSDRDQARICFEKAIEIDPSFARPYAALAVMFSHGGAIRGGGGGGEGPRIARQWAEKALQLDDSLAEAHAALAWVLLEEWNFAESEREFRRAIVLNPSLSRARAWYAQFLGAMERYPEAFVQTQAALQLAPGSPDLRSHAVAPYLNGGRVDDAIAQWRAALFIQPDYWAAHHFLALAYVKKGFYQQALAEAEETERLTNRDVNSLILLAVVYARSGQRQRSLDTLHELERQLDRTGARRPADRARVYAALGDKGKALDLLEEAYRGHKAGLAFVNTRVEFEALRSDPRFRDLVRRIGLPVNDRRASGTPLA